MNYQPLSETGSEIRILVVEPADSKKSRIQCRLEHVPLAAASDYVALSYCWGRPDMTVRIKVNGRSHSITPSLAAALAELRHRKYSRVWADAICINQNDMEERSRQVLRMAAIYRSAREVIAHLGPADMKNTQGIFQLRDALRTFLGFNSKRDVYQKTGEKHPSTAIIQHGTQSIKNLETLDEQKMRKRALSRVVRGIRNYQGKTLTPSPTKDRSKNTVDAWKYFKANLQDSHWVPLANLLGCEYWSRAWIIQEIAMANRLKIMWGSCCFALNDIASLLVSYEAINAGGLIDDIVPHEPRRHIKNLVKFYNFQNQLSAIPLITALQMASFAKSTDTRDKIYSLMGLTYDGAVIFPSPSYRDSLRSINEEASMRVVRLKRSLEYLVFRGAPPDSWAIDWSNPETWSDSRTVSYLTGNPQHRPGSCTIKISEPQIRLKDGNLSAKGRIVDTIRVCSATYDERQSGGKAINGFEVSTSAKPIPDEYLSRCFQMANTKDTMGRWEFFNNLREALFREFTSDNLEKSQYYGLFEWISCSSNAEFTIRHRTLRRHFRVRRAGIRDIRNKRSSPSYLEIDLMMNTIKLGMRLGETTRKRVGWFTRFAKPGDKIAFVLGCSAPVVLRPKDDGTFLLVGDGVIFGPKRYSTKSLSNEIELR